MKSLNCIGSMYQFCLCLEAREKSFPHISVNLTLQLGEWYLTSKCKSSTFAKILGKKTDESPEFGALIEPCCSAQPLFKCYYSDKPSKKPCKDSPKIDKAGKPFWK